MRSSVALIVNPVSGAFSSRRLSASIELLRKRYSDVSVQYTEGKGDAERLVREAVRHSPEMILIVGGDGTFNEAANSAAFSDVPLGFIPSGTTNVLARELSIPNDIYRATERAVDGRPEYINLGSINGRYFVLMAGIGYDGETVYGIRRGIKRISGKGAYILSGLGVLLNYNPKRLFITVDDREYEGYGLILCNARKYAGDFVVCPDAGLTMPYLSVFIVHNRRRLDLLKYVTGIITGRHLRLKGITLTKGRSISVSEGAHIQVDGDYYGISPVSIGISERALRIIR